MYEDAAWVWPEYKYAGILPFTVCREVTGALIRVFIECVGPPTNTPTLSMLNC